MEQNFCIQEPSPFNPKWLSHKFEGPGIWCEVGICLQTGWIVWWNGAFPCGSYPDLNITWQWLIDEFDNDIGKSAPFNDRGQYFIMPSRQNDYIDKMMTVVRVQHKMVNKLLKEYNML